MAAMAHSQEEIDPLDIRSKQEKAAPSNALSLATLRAAPTPTRARSVIQKDAQEALSQNEVQGGLQISGERDAASPSGGRSIPVEIAAPGSNDDSPLCPPPPLQEILAQLERNFETTRSMYRGGLAAIQKIHESQGNVRAPAARTDSQMTQTEVRFSEEGNLRHTQDRDCSLQDAASSNAIQAEGAQAFSETVAAPFSHHNQVASARSSSPSTAMAREGSQDRFTAIPKVLARATTPTPIDSEYCFDPKKAVRSTRLVPRARRLGPANRVASQPGIPLCSDHGSDSHWNNNEVQNNAAHTARAVPSWAMVQPWQQLLSQNREPQRSVARAPAHITPTLSPREEELQDRRARCSPGSVCRRVAEFEARSASVARGCSPTNAQMPTRSTIGFMQSSLARSLPCGGGECNTKRWRYESPLSPRCLQEECRKQRSCATVVGENETLSPTHWPLHTVARSACSNVSGPAYCQEGANPVPRAASVRDRIRLLQAKGVVA